MRRPDLYKHSKEPIHYQRKVDWLLDHCYEQTPEGLTLTIIVPQRNAKVCFKHTVSSSELHDIDYDVLEAYDARVWAKARREIIESMPR